jgi:hypothetical protein
MANPSKDQSLLADKNDKPLITTQQANIADAKVDYADDGSADDLDTDAKRVAAANATNTTINSILAVLEAHGLTADS